MTKSDFTIEKEDAASMAGSSPCHCEQSAASVELAIGKPSGADRAPRGHQAKRIYFQSGNPSIDYNELYKQVNLKKGQSFYVDVDGEIKTLFLEDGDYGAILWADSYQFYPAEHYKINILAPVPTHEELQQVIDALESLDTLINDDMAGIIFGDTHKLSKEHKADIEALDKLHTIMRDKSDEALKILNKE